MQPGAMHPARTDLNQGVLPFFLLPSISRENEQSAAFFLPSLGCSLGFLLEFYCLASAVVVLLLVSVLLGFVFFFLPVETCCSLVSALGFVASWFLR